jgi:hypothetical protein
VDGIELVEVATLRDAIRQALDGAPDDGRERVAAASARC